MSEILKRLLLHLYIRIQAQYIIIERYIKIKINCYRLSFMRCEIIPPCNKHGVKLQEN